MNDEELERLKKLVNSEDDCECYDKSFDEFNKCCGKKHNVENPLEILFNMVEKMHQESRVQRLGDMAPEKAQKTLEKIFNILGDNND